MAGKQTIAGVVRTVRLEVGKKKEKEKYIKEVAKYYKNTYAKFPEKIYKAMINYKIEISD